HLVDQRTDGGCAVVVGEGVAQDPDPGGVLERDAAAGGAAHVVHDDVVEHVDLVPTVQPLRLPGHILTVHEGQTNAAAVAGSGHIALDEVGEDGHGSRTFGKPAGNLRAFDGDTAA